MDEIALIKQAAQGDDSAFEQLVLANEKNIYNVTLRIVKNPEDAFDMTQETFIKAWRAISLFQFDSKFSTWLCRIARNTCIDHLRKEKKHSLISFTQYTDQDDAEELSLPDLSNDPATLLEAASDYELVHAAMEQLPEQYRVALSLRAVEGMTYEEIGKALDINTGTVKSRICRAREKLSLILGNISADTSSKSRKGGIG